jgi:hypothetical protein
VRGGGRPSGCGGGGTRDCLFDFEGGLVRFCESVDGDENFPCRVSSSLSSPPSSNGDWSSVTTTRVGGFANGSPPPSRVGLSVSMAVMAVGVAMVTSRVDGVGDVEAEAGSEGTLLRSWSGTSRDSRERRTAWFPRPPPPPPRDAWWW